MKATDVDRMTVIYRRRQTRNGPGNKTVILSTGIWLPQRFEGRSTGDILGYRMLPPGSRATGWRESGWLCLTVNQFSDAAQALTDEQILAAGKEAFAVIEAGTTPDLPEGLMVSLVSPREIIQTWAQYEQSIVQGRRAQVEAEARLAEQQAADEAARERILSVVPEGTLLPVARRMNMQTTGVWDALEDLLNAFHETKTANEQITTCNCH